MVINRIHIQRFGALCDRDFSVMPGLNIIEGENESGKTTVAAFLRYIFYGIRGNTAASRFLKIYPEGLPSEPIGGFLDITVASPLPEVPDVITYRITRLSTSADDEGTECRICPLYGDEVGEAVYTDVTPGELFFGVSGDVAHHKQLGSLAPCSAFIDSEIPLDKGVSLRHGFDLGLGGKEQFAVGVFGGNIGLLGVDDHIFRKKLFHIHIFFHEDGSAGGKINAVFLDEAAKTPA